MMIVQTLYSYYIKFIDYNSNNYVNKIDANAADASIKLLDSISK